MKYSKVKISSYGKIHGGKARYARQYISLLNAEGMTSYYEPYCAGGGVGMNLDHSAFKNIVFNDIDKNIYRTLYTLRDDADRVIQCLQKVPYSQESFNDAGVRIGCRDDVIHTVAYITRNRMSSGGMFDRFAETDTKVRLRGGQMGDKNAWENFINKHIYKTVETIHNVEIINQNAIEFIETRVLFTTNQSKTLYFIDPPYLESTVVTKNPYFCNVDREHHVDLLNLITSIPGRFYLCGYYSDLYNDVLVKQHNWRFHSFERAADSGRTKNKSRRIEYLWYSPSCWEAV